jgi:hypothetical protein
LPESLDTLRSLPILELPLRDDRWSDRWFYVVHLISPDKQQTGILNLRLGRNGTENQVEPASCGADHLTRTRVGGVIPGQ